MTKSEKIKIIIGTISAFLVAIGFMSIIQFVTERGSNNQSNQACGASVENWIEGRTNSYGGAGFFTISYNSKVMLNINSSTAACLGIVNNNRLDTGENYLYVNPGTQHFDIISKEQVQQHQNNGDLCLTAEQSWDNIGKKRACVGYRVTYMKRSNGFTFLNEKEDYINGFVAAIAHDYLITWDDAVTDYNGRDITVTGAIEEYQNHPEIKIYELKQISNNPTPYAYSTKYGFVYKTTGSKL